jgi:hypothetical protein
VRGIQWFFMAAGFWQVFPDGPRDKKPALLMAEVPAFLSGRLPKISLA